MSSDGYSRLRMTRTSEWKKRFRSFKVFIDEEFVGSIKNGSTVEYKVIPGTHNIYLKIDWCMTSIVEVECGLGKPVEILCGSSDWAKKFTIPSPDGGAYIELWLSNRYSEED